MMSGNAQPTENKTGWRFSVMNAKDLQKKEYPPLHFLVDKILPAGLVVLSAPPKYGKSWFALSLALCIAEGKSFLGFSSSQSVTLYCGLEDSFRRLKERIGKLFENKEWPEDCYLTTEAASLAGGLIDDIRSFKKEHPKLGLVVLDLFKNVRPSGDARGAYSYDRDYDDIRRLKDVASELGICIMVVMHNRKMRDEVDIFNNIMGTSGISGAVDTIIVLQKDLRATERAELHIIGKDVESRSLQIKMVNCMWQLDGLTAEDAAAQAQMNFEADPIIKTVKALYDKHRGAYTIQVSDLLAEAVERYGECGTHTSQELKRFFKQNSVQLARMWIHCDTEIHNSSKGARVRFEPIKEQEDNYEQGNLLQDLPGM